MSVKVIDYETILNRYISESEDQVIQVNQPVTVINNVEETKVYQDNSDTVVIQVPEVKNIFHEMKQVVVLTETIQGLPGVSESEMDYERRVDNIDEYTLYKGKANPGTLNSEAGWKITKVTISPVDDDSIESWANGTSDQDKIWDDRTTYTYQN